MDLHTPRRQLIGRIDGKTDRVLLFDLSSFDCDTIKACYMITITTKNTKRTEHNKYCFEWVSYTYAQYKRCKKVRSFVDTVRANATLDKYETLHGKIELLHDLPIKTNNDGNKENMGL